MALDDGTRELRRALTDPEGSGSVFEAAITDEEGILSEILARLPVKSVFRFRCVCKPWCALIAAPFFRDKHFDYAQRGIGHNRLLFSMEPPRSLDLEALKNIDLEEEDCVDAISELHSETFIDWATFILGSCNGLLCLYVHLIGIRIWNPSTRETSNFLPITPPITTSCIYGFGYDSTTDDYKLVISRSSTNALWKIHIFAPKTGLWKTLPNRYKQHLYVTYRSYGRFFNGALHWFVRAKCNQRATVLFFNLEEEEGFQEMAPLPDIIIPPNPVGQCAELLVLGNCLSLVQLFLLSDFSSVCVVMEYGVVTKSWTQVMNFSIGPLESSFRTLSILKHILKHGMVLVKKVVNDKVTGLLVNQTSSKIIFEADSRPKLGLDIYTESLVSPVTFAGGIAGYQ